MYTLMAKQRKDMRVYFRVAENFKQEFAAAAAVRGFDPSEAFRYIGTQFIDRTKQDKPEEFSRILKEIQSEDSEPDGGKNGRGIRKVSKPAGKDRSRQSDAVQTQRKK